MQIGYARVSTDEQHLELQVEALEKAGCEQIFTDKISGTRVNRPGLDDALSHICKGDTLAVWKLGRLGSSVKGLVYLAADLEQRQMTESKIASARKLLEGGAAPKDVAHDLGVSVPTLYRRLPASARS